MEILKVGFSPCPNDTFIFGALAKGKIPGVDFAIECLVSDVENLNRMAQEKALDVTKISVGSYPAIAKDYVMLTTAAALTESEGPMIVSKRPLSLEELRTASIAIPGKGTTANMLLDIFDLHTGPRVETTFSDIMPMVRDETVEAGVIIHEGRWTYKSYGLLEVLDLGRLWVQTFSLPLPLGVIVIKRDLAERGIAKIFNELIKKSIKYARERNGEIYSFILEFASEMDKEIIYKHIEAFVNEFSEDLGDRGRMAIIHFLEQMTKKGFNLAEKIFWNE
ncbi:MAG: 1,4-dihydroxy-6-naphthoate synthase [Syntrophobacterales bacterium]|nr:1,4-dihydroxy-6-naphthoate synthase [Syntrophobacterales bacterium]